MPNRSVSLTTLAITFSVLSVLSGCRNGPSSWSSRDKSSDDSIARRDFDRAKNRRLADDRRYSEDRYRDDRNSGLRDRGDREEIDIRPKRRDDTPRRDQSIAIARHTTDRPKNETGRLKNPFAFIKNRRKEQGKDPFLNARGLADNSDDGPDDRRGDAQPRPADTRTRQFPVERNRAIARSTNRDDVVPSLDEHPNQFSRGFERSMRQLNRGGNRQVANHTPVKTKAGTSAPSFPQVASRKPEQQAIPAARSNSATQPEGVNPFARFSKKPQTPVKSSHTPTGFQVAKSVSPAVTSHSSANDYKPLRANTVSKRPLAPSTAQLPDPTRSPDVSQLSEGDPSLIVDSNNDPVKSAKPPRIPSSSSFKDSPTIPSVRPSTMPPQQTAPNSGEPEIKIIPRNTKRDSGRIFHSASTTEQPDDWKNQDDKTDKQPATKTPSVLQAAATKSKPFKSLEEPSPFDSEPMPAKPLKAEVKPPVFAPEAPAVFPPHGEANPMPTESVNSPFAQPQPIPHAEQHAAASQLATSPTENLEADETDEPNRSWLWVVSLLLLIGIGAAVHKRRSLNFA